MSRNHVKAGLNGKKWKRVRRRVLERDNYRCQSCGYYAKSPEIDHIRPIDRGGMPWDLSNLQTLCRACHVRKTAMENEHHNPDRDAWRELVRELSL